MKLYLNRYPPIMKNASDEVHFPYTDKTSHPTQQINALG